jgi:hypothetical protein
MSGPCNSGAEAPPFPALERNPGQEGEQEGLKPGPLPGRQEQCLPGTAARGAF